jgi:hypothetical protein
MRYRNEYDRVTEDFKHNGHRPMTPPIREHNVRWFFELPPEIRLGQPDGREITFRDGDIPAVIAWLHEIAGILGGSRSV